MSVQVYRELCDRHRRRLGFGQDIFVNLILEELSEAPDILITGFNPWNFSSQDELIREFFGSLADKMRGQIKEEKTALKAITRYARKLSVLVAPEVSFWGVKVGLGQLRGHGGKGTLEQDRVIIDRLMQQLHKKIVVVIDDTDRLDNDETKLVFKLVKMTANFPNTIFLIAFDREKVAKKIQEDGLPGEEYLKKIVQVNFRLPQPEQQDLHRILFRDVDSVIGDMNQKKWDANRWNSLFHSGFEDFFKTVRDIKRYVSSLSLDFSIIGREEVNPVDFLGIEIIRVFAPDIYTAIGSNKELFTEGQLSAWERDKEAGRREAEKILELAQDDRSRDSLRKLLKELFPRLDSLYGGASYGPNWESEWRRMLRVAASDIFGRYFHSPRPPEQCRKKQLSH